MPDSLEASSLLYHSIEPAGKLTVTPTKPLANQIDLAQAYSPGVAYPCLRIEKNPLDAGFSFSEVRTLQLSNSGLNGHQAYDLTFCFMLKQNV